MRWQIVAAMTPAPHSRPLLRRRFVLTCAIAALVAMSASEQASAAQYIYAPSNAGSDPWSAGTSWNAAPIGALDTRLTFVADNATVLADGLNNTNTNDLAGEFQLNILDLQGTGPASGPATININAAAPATGLTLISSATTPVVNLNAVNGVAGLTYNANPALTLTNDTLFTGAGTATFNFNGGINGANAALAKTGASVLRLGGFVSLASLTVGSNTAGGSIVALPGSSFSIGGGLAGQTLSIGAASNAVSSGALDLSASSGLTANVATVVVGSTGSTGSNTGQGTLNLGASNFITATTSFVVGNSGAVFNGVTSTVRAAANGFTSIETPILTIGGNKSRGEFILESGASLSVSGPNSGRTAMTVGSTSTGGGSGAWSGLANFGDGVFSGNLSSLVIGTRSVTSSTASVVGTMTIGTNEFNHLDVSGTSQTFGGVVVIGRAAGGTTTGSATGTLTIGNLDAASRIVSTNNGTGILIGVNGTGPTGTGTLNLNGGTLSIATTGSAIAGGSGTSTVNFNGTILRAGASSGSWITGLTTANVATGGAIIDTNGFFITVGQALTGTGSLTKEGAGQLTLTGTNSYAGKTLVNGGLLFAKTTAALPGYNIAGNVVVAEGGGLAVSIGGAGEFALADVEAFRTNGTFLGTHSIGIDTTNAGPNTVYTSSLNSLFSLTKIGANTLTLSNNTTTLGSLSIGVNNEGGSVITPAGSAVSVGTGFGESLNIGVTSTGTKASGVFDVSAATNFTANVVNIIVGSAANNSVTGVGILNLPANNNIIASTAFTIGNSAGAFNEGDSIVTTGNGGTTLIETLTLTIGGTKSRGSFTLGAGSTLDVSGVDDSSTALAIGRSAIEGGTGNWSGTADFSAGIFKAKLSSLVIGYTDAGSGQWTENGVLTLSNNTANHLEISGAGNPVQIGRWINGAATTSNGNIAAVGTLTIGALDDSSSIVAIDDSTAILIGVGGVDGAQRASGTLNLNGGTLGITTAGSAISGDTANLSNVSTVNFNGTTLKAGASSTNWISGLTNANVGAGGAKFDTNGFDITIAQSFVHDPALAETSDGGLSKSGSGTLVLGGVNTYTGGTTVSGGTLIVTGTLNGTSGVSVNSGAALGGTGTITAATTFAGGATLLAGDGLNAAGALTLSGNVTLGDNSVIRLTLGDLLTHSSLVRNGTGTWVFDSNQAFSLFDAGAVSGIYDNVISGLAADPGTSSWSIITDGFTGIFTYDGTGGVDLALTVVPEPTSMTALIGGIGMVLGLRRRRKE